MAGPASLLGSGGGPAGGASGSGGLVVKSMDQLLPLKFSDELPRSQVLKELGGDWLRESDGAQPETVLLP